MTPEFPGPLKQGAGRCLGRFSHGGTLLFLQLRGGSADGQAHIGPGIPVGDWEYVQVVDVLLLGTDGGGGMDDHLLKGRCVNGLCHIGDVPFYKWLKPHGVHKDVHGSHFHAGGLAHHIAHLAHDGAADGDQIDAVFHDDVQLDGDGPVLVVIYFDSLGHGFPLEQMDQAVGLERTAMPFTP